MKVIAASMTAPVIVTNAIRYRSAFAQNSSQPSANGVAHSTMPMRLTPSAMSAAAMTANTIAAGTSPSAIAPGRRRQKPKPRASSPTPEANRLITAPA